MANGVPTIADLANPGPESIEGVIPNAPFSFSSFAPIFGAGRGVFSALQGDVGGALSGGLGALGTIIGGPLGGIAGGLIGSSLGGAFGGGRSVRPGFPATDPSALEGTFLGDISIPGGGEVRGRSFRQGATNLAEEIQFISPAIDREVGILRNMGFADLADDLEGERTRLFNASPASQAAGRAQNQNLVNLLGTSIKLRNSILNTSLESPELSAQFETDTGVPIGDFVNEINRQDQVFTREFNLPAQERSLSELRDATALFRPNFTGGGRGGVRQPAGFFSPGERIGRGQRRGREVISTGEFNRRQEEIASRERDIGDIRDFINAPGIDITGAGSQFGNLFNTFVQNAPTGVPAGPGQGQVPQPPDVPQQPTQRQDLPNLPISQLLKLLPQNEEQPPASLDFNIPQFNFGQLGFGSNFGVESTLGGNNIFSQVLGASPQQSLEPASGTPFSPTGGSLFSTKQNAPRGLAFLS